MKAKEIIHQLEVLSSEEATHVNHEKINSLKSADAAGLHNFLLSLAAYWSIIKLALKFVKLFTGPKADIKIDQVIEWGDTYLV